MGLAQKLKPVDGQGVKVVTSGLEIVLVGAATDKASGQRGSPISQILKGDVGEGLQDYINIIKAERLPYRSIAKATLVAAGIGMLFDKPIIGPFVFK